MALGGGSTARTMEGSCAVPTIETHAMYRLPANWFDYMVAAAAEGAIALEVRATRAVVRRARPAGAAGVEGL